MDNPDKNVCTCCFIDGQTIQTKNGVFRVIQRDDRHVYASSISPILRIAVSSPVGKQRCIGVHATMNGLLIVAFYWYYHEIDDSP